MSEVEAYSRLAGVYDEFVVDPCFALWADFLAALWSLDTTGVSRVLDVCCGTGLMAAELAERGFDVTGLDASAAMLERARALVGPDVPLLHQTLPSLDVPGEFDAVISTYDGLNYLPPADFEAALTALAAHIRPRGWLVFDLHADRMFQMAVSTPHVGFTWHGATVDIEYETDVAARTCTSRIAVSGDDGGYVEVHPQFIHDDTTVRAVLAHAGFDSMSVVDEYTLAPASTSTLRATWMARRAR